MKIANIASSFLSILTLFLSSLEKKEKYKKLIQGLFVENPFSFKFEIAIFIFPFSLFLLKIFDHSSHFSFKLSKISNNSFTYSDYSGG